MNSIASAIVYNLFIAEKELKKNKQTRKKPGLFGPEKTQNSREVIDFDQLLPFKINYDEEDAFFIFYGFMRYANMKKFFQPGMSFLQQKINDFELYMSHRFPDLHFKMCREMDVIFTH